jgi:ribonuclease-3
MNHDLSPLMTALGYTFQDPSLLRTALTHRSYCNEVPGQTGHNERLEFLGDAILNFLAGAVAYERFPDAGEGLLTRLRAQVVCEPSLADLAREVGLGPFLRLGRGAAQGDKAAANPSILADAFEAVVAAICLDGGLDAARAFAGLRLAAALDRAARIAGPGDAKTALQERCLAQWREVPRYEVLERLGPSHNPRFRVRVTLPDGRTAEAEGRSRKDAEQAAAGGVLE